MKGACSSCTLPRNVIKATHVETISASDVLDVIFLNLCYSLLLIFHLEKSFYFRIISKSILLTKNKLRLCRFVGIDHVSSIAFDFYQIFFKELLHNPIFLWFNVFSFINKHLHQSIEVSRNIEGISMQVHLFSIHTEPIECQIVFFEENWIDLIVFTQGMSLLSLKLMYFPHFFLNFRFFTH